LKKNGCRKLALHRVLLHRRLDGDPLEFGELIDHGTADTSGKLIGSRMTET